MEDELEKKAMFINLSQERIILPEVEIADTFLRRLQGLWGRKSLPPGQGLVIKPCRAVHTVGLYFPIDIAFVNRENRICCLKDVFPPWKVSPVIRPARYVVEAPAGTFKQTQTKEGDLVKLKTIRKPVRHCHCLKSV
ncbi:MAG: DUF192 domain-containing protein [Firmicutes bacterium]|nr:DUF192 domain-containing protein [Bacillota bacterium]